MRGMPREGIHQRGKYFAHGSRNVRSALNHLRFKDANVGSGSRKEDKANGCSIMVIPETQIQLPKQMHFIFVSSSEKAQRARSKQETVC